MRVFNSMKEYYEYYKVKKPKKKYSKYYSMGQEIAEKSCNEDIRKKVNDDC